MELPPLDHPATTPALMHAAAARFGDAEFIVTPDRRLTFAEAERASRRFGQQLLAAGVGKATRVGAMLANGTEWVVAWMGVTRIGALFMPFSSAYQPAELRKAVRFGDVDTLVVPATQLGRDRHAFVEEAIPGLAGAVGPGAGRGADAGRLWLAEFPYLRSVRVSGASDRAWAQPADLDHTVDTGDHGIGDDLFAAVEAQVSPADLMATIFTSGTTSDPKAVTYTHGGFVRHGANQARFSGATTRDVNPRLYCSAPFFWIGGFGLVNGALVTGETILAAERFDPDVVIDLMERESSLRFHAWPPQQLRLRRHIEATGRDVRGIPGLAASPTTGLRHNSLGMTESIGPHSAAGPEADRVLPEELRHSFGLPIPYIELRVVDPLSGEVLGEEQEGELCVRGYSLMDGLYKRERHESLDDNGWYHTGDRCLFRQGYVIFHGRMGEMIKTAGANVAPSEVEDVLASLPGVGMAVVVGLPDPERDEIVAAVLVAEGDAEVDAATAIERAARELSSYKVPRRVLVLRDNELPILSNGKADRRRLRQLVAEAGQPVGRGAR
jgi:acyl-CoA synthetase (AMP-forming)/AMP-acid ligase II